MDSDFGLGPSQADDLTRESDPYYTFSYDYRFRQQRLIEQDLYLQQQEEITKGEAELPRVEDVPPTKKVNPILLALADVELSIGHGREQDKAVSMYAAGKDSIEQAVARGFKVDDATHETIRYLDTLFSSERNPIRGWTPRALDSTIVEVLACWSEPNSDLFLYPYDYQSRDRMKHLPTNSSHSVMYPRLSMNHDARQLVEVWHTAFHLYRLCLPGTAPMIEYGRLHNGRYEHRYVIGEDSDQYYRPYELMGGDYVRGQTLGYLWPSSTKVPSNYKNAVEPLYRVYRG